MFRGTNTINMKQFTQLICPVSTERVDENQVRVTALGVVIIMGAHFVTGSALFPALLALDFFIRAFTRLTYSPLSYLAHLFVRLIGTKAVLIDKAPKGFAGIAIGLALTLIHLISIPITNTSVNPARSLSQALFADGAYLSQVWLFWVAPVVGAIIGGVIHKTLFEKE